jgi:hypothetical protein
MDESAEDEKIEALHNDPSFNKQDSERLDINSILKSSIDSCHKIDELSD